MITLDDNGGSLSTVYFTYSGAARSWKQETVYGEIGICGTPPV